ncbi:hypothetical protein COB52_05125 [Candidatus Kaiserbacteria bacterium]|nr:MAG: hypothetical protein COB52_05125 [Candidatus Kaiserbacteria bacterium]
MKNASNTEIPKFQVHYTSPDVVPTMIMQKMEGLFKQEIVRSRALSFKWIFMHVLDRYNHLMFFPFRNRALEEFNLLRPRTSFFVFIQIAGLTILWIIAVFLTGAVQGDGLSIGAGFGYGVIVALLASGLVYLFTHYFYKLFLMDVRRAFDVGRELQMKRHADNEIEEYSPRGGKDD